MRDHDKSLLDWLCDVSPEIRAIVASNLDPLELLTFVVNNKPMFSDSPSKVSKLNVVRQSFWAVFLEKMPPDFVPLLKGQGIDHRNNDFVQHVMILDKMIDKAQKATLVVVNPDYWDAFFFHRTTGTLAVRSAASLLIAKPLSHLRFCHVMASPNGFRMLKRFGVLENVKHLDIVDMAITTSGILDPILNMATTLKKVTFSNVECKDVHELARSKLHRTPVVVDELYLQNCTDHTQLLFCFIKATTLEINEGEVTIVPPHNGNGGLDHRHQSYRNWRLHGYYYYSTTNRHYTLAHLLTLKHLTLSIDYLSRDNFLGRIPRTLEVLEVRDCDPTATMPKISESWIEELCYYPADRYLPDLRRLVVHFSTVPSLRDVRLHDQLQLQFLLPKNIEYQYDYPRSVITTQMTTTSHGKVYFHHPFLS